MRKVLWIIALMISLVMVTLVSAIHAQEVPSKIAKCIENGASELLSSTNKQNLWRIYTKYTDKDQLGWYIYGKQPWLKFSQKKKDYGYKIFFDSLYGVSNKPDNALDASSTQIASMRLTEKNPSLVKALNGQKVTIYRVVTKVTDKTGKEVVAVVYISTKCKVFDLQQGPLLSDTVDASMIEAWKG